MICTNHLHLLLSYIVPVYGRTGIEEKTVTCISQTYKLYCSYRNLLCWPFIFCLTVGVEEHKSVPCAHYFISYPHPSNRVVNRRRRYNHYNAYMHKNIQTSKSSWKCCDTPTYINMLQVNISVVRWPL